MCQLSNIIIQILVQRFIEINMSLSLYLYGKVLCMPGMFITSEKLVFLILKAFMTGFFVLFFFFSLIPHSTFKAKDLHCCKATSCFSSFYQWEQEYWHLWWFDMQFFFPCSVMLFSHYLPVIWVCVKHYIISCGCILFHIH